MYTPDSNNGRPPWCPCSASTVKMRRSLLVQRAGREEAVFIDLGGYTNSSQEGLQAEGIAIELVSFVG